VKNINLRLNLSHFFNKEWESDVMEKLKVIHSKRITFFLYLWYEDGSLSPDDLKDFLVKYESSLEFKTNIRSGNKLKLDEFIWFDIIEDKFAGQSNQIRFEYIYDKEEQLLDGLEEFDKCAIFCTSEKPSKQIRKQKRNDYESSDSRE